MSSNSSNSNESFWKEWKGQILTGLGFLLLIGLNWWKPNIDWKDPKSIAESISSTKPKVDSNEIVPQKPSQVIVPKIRYKIQDESSNLPLHGAALSILDSTYYSNEQGLISIAFQQAFVENTPQCFVSKNGYVEAKRLLSIDTNQVIIINLSKK